MRSLVLAALIASAAALAQGPVDPNAPLPPGHPSLDGTSSSSQKPGPVDPNAPLPPGHPSLGGAPSSSMPAPGLVDPNQPLPPNHPPLDGSAPKPIRTPVDPNAPLPAGHPKIDPSKPAPSAEDLMKQLDSTKDLKTREKTFEVAVALGKLYYAHGRFADSIDFLKEAVGKAEPTRTFFLDQKKRAAAAKKELPSADTVGCMPGPDSTLDSLAKLAADKAKAGDPAAAAACARAALHPLMEVESQLANAMFITHDVKGAQLAYNRELEVFESSPDALFGRAAIALDVDGDNVDALKKAKADFEKFVSDYPMHPRANEAKAFVARIDEAVAKGGMSKLNAAKAEERKARLANLAMSAPRAPFAPFAGGAQGGAGVPAVSKEAMDAVKNTEVTPEMQQQFASLLDEAEDHLAHGRYQDALDNYKRVVPFQPDNGRAKAGMAWSLVGLDKQPMADRVWMVAVGADPAAVDKLGDSLKAKGAENDAKKLWAKLAQTDASYAARANLASKLK